MKFRAAFNVELEGMGWLKGSELEQLKDVLSQRLASCWGLVSGKGEFRATVNVRLG